MSSSIGWILVVSGVVTAVGGFTVLLIPAVVLRAAFAAGPIDGLTQFFVRHWGVLIFVVGALIAWSAYAPAIRTPVLLAGAVEKFAVVALVFFGPAKRTAAMTAIAAGDGLFALLYGAYLAGF